MNIFPIPYILCIPYNPGILDIIGVIDIPDIPDILCIPGALMLCENRNALKSESSLSLTHSVTDKMDPRDAYASKNTQKMQYTTQM